MFRQSHWSYNHLLSHPLTLILTHAISLPKTHSLARFLFLIPIHTQILIHYHMHFLTFSLARSSSSLTRTPSPSHSRTHARHLSLARYFFLSLLLTHAIPLSHSLKHATFLSFSHSHSTTLSLSHTFTLAISLSNSLEHARHLFLTLSHARTTPPSLTHAHTHSYVTLAQKLTSYLSLTRSFLSFPLNNQNVLFLAYIDPLAHFSAFAWGFPTRSQKKLQFSRRVRNSPKQKDPNIVLGGRTNIWVVKREPNWPKTGSSNSDQRQVSATERQTYPMSHLSVQKRTLWYQIY